MPELTVADINTMRVADLKKILTDLVTKGTAPTPPCDVKAMLKDIMTELKEAKEERASLRAEIDGLKNINEELLAAINARPPSMAMSAGASSPPQGGAFADVVRSSVRSALQNEEHLKEVIMSKIEEHGRDDTVVSDLCQKMNFCSRPTDVKRLGKKPTNDNYRRLLKMTFSSVFNSRVFRSRFNEMKKEYETLRRIRLRPGRTKEEHEEYKNSVTIANKLNDEAKKSENNTSYSVRDNDKNTQALVITETWIKPGDGLAIVDLCPRDFTLIHKPRPTSNGERGSGIGILILSSIPAEKVPSEEHRTFESMEVKIKARK
ncbi:hypothetical protein CAPTEDRAFT_190799 [Capitella teleta]|uniref:Uncharacterized protein n=1 Tax=Capitella teleta TaxID=283909 RepID=R7TP19_CAPTE|nr:hypothetical protein CAPTEDRAFT_190799 [Capitella teleta]|eukprot:ELT95384.1 hypothetical protein CAPTEDRAFT_190799 [Capitella teleta]